MKIQESKYKLLKKKVINVIVIGMEKWRKLMENQESYGNWNEKFKKVLKSNKKLLKKFFWSVIKSC